MSWGDHQHQRMVDMILEPGVWIQGSPTWFALVYHSYEQFYILYDPNNLPYDFPGV